MILNPNDMNLQFKTGIFLLLFVAASCGKEVAIPDVDLTASKNRVAVNEPVTFTATGTADGFALYTGDAGHEFEYSKYALTKDKDIEKEIVYLTPAGYDSLKVAGLLPDSVLSVIKSLTGIRYNGLSVPTEKILEFTNYELQFDPVLPQVQAYFTIEHFAGAPLSGYATGVALDPEVVARTYTYAYTAPGAYTVYLLATNVGHKKYTAQGYNENRITSQAEYDRSTQLKSITITVE